ncbi:uncharacterized protein PV09_00142 [Verruconis gallopava]|uniref:Uncharacterized protein n=1 Tax=Verruconis gallopava TaxID=253628 RepID=A0A0D2ARR1_9PEZI|nr:uncharacterized protein PV09_00142 [Verruconis gallopava]KIW09215.1 hypothetical protein PV09_00142 [Verruconis gallopava]
MPRIYSNTAASRSEIYISEPTLIGSSNIGLDPGCVAPSCLAMPPSPFSLEAGRPFSPRPSTSSGYSIHSHSHSRSSSLSTPRYASPPSPLAPFTHATANQSFFCPSTGSKKCKQDCPVCRPALRPEKSSGFSSLRRRYAEWRSQRQQLKVEDRQNGLPEIRISTF